jgi:hypothetical protein
MLDLAARLGAGSELVAQEGMIGTELVRWRIAIRPTLVTWHR